MEHEAARFTDSQITQISECASVDKRSVLRRLAGLPVKGLAGRRIDAVLAQWPLIEDEARGEAP